MKTKNRMKAVILLVGILAILLSFAGIAQAEITRGPYLQPVYEQDPATGAVLEDLSTAIIIACRTTTGSPVTIYYKKKGDATERSQQVTCEATPDEYMVGVESIIEYKYHTKLTGLEPGQTYQYRIVESGGDTRPVPGDGDDGGDYYEFRTSPRDGVFHNPDRTTDKTRIIVTSDWHGTYFATFYEDMLKFKPDVVVNCGDYANDKVGFREIFNRGQKLFATSIVVIAVGNHDFDAQMKEQFYFPKNGSSDWGVNHDDLRGIEYSFDYGKTHIIVEGHYAGYGPAIVDYEWLVRDAQRARQRGSDFIISATHCPSISDPIALNALYDGGVDVKVNGHLHGFARTYPIIPNRFGPSQPQGIIFTNEKNNYTAQNEGVIHVTCRSSVRHLYNPQPTNLYMAGLGDRRGFLGASLLVGYIELTIGDKIFNGSSYVYQTFPRALPREEQPEDTFTINKNITDELPTPVISDIAASNITAYMAEISWNSKDGNGNPLDTRGQVAYGTTAGNYPYVNMREDQNQQFLSAHHQTIQCLEPNTTYYYEVRSWRAGKEMKVNQNASGQPLTFTTSSPRSGELVADFDFGTIALAPFGTRASIEVLDETTGLRIGWDKKAVIDGEPKAKPDGWPYDATDTWLAHNYAGSALVNKWHTNIPNGTYDVEVKLGKSGSIYWGSSKMIFENGQLQFAADKPALIDNEWKETVWTWTGQVNVNDGKLDIEFGGTGTLINQLKIFNQGSDMTYDTTPPAADAGPDQIVAKDTLVNFDGSNSTDDIGGMTYLWNFGDGTTGTGVKPTHTYTTEGEYAVTLTIHDAAGNGPVTDTLTVTVVTDNVAPVSAAVPAGGKYFSPVSVTLLSNEQDTIYYTLDGTDPQAGASNTFSGANPIKGIAISRNTTLKFFAVDNYGNQEAVKTENYAFGTAYLHTYHLQSGAPAGGDGSIDSPFNSIPDSLKILKPGDILYLRGGTYTTPIAVPSGVAGNATAGPITIKAYNNEQVVIKAKAVLLSPCNYFVIDGITFDGDWVAGTDGLIKPMPHFIMRNCEVMNTSSKGIFLRGKSINDVLIENCRIHDCLGLVNNAVTGCAIDVSGANGIIIRDSEIYYTSVACLLGGIDNVYIENCRFWNGPLPTERGGVPQGKNVGFYGIHQSSGSGSVDIRNLTIYGWKSDYQYSYSYKNACAFKFLTNPKVNLDGITAYDSKNCFWIEGVNPKVTIKNAVVYDITNADTTSNISAAVYYKGKPNMIKIYNSTFGNNITNLFKPAVSIANDKGREFIVKNSLFLSVAKPAEAGDPSNMLADDSFFIDSANNNYRIPEDSPAVDAGEFLQEVTIDRIGITRPQGQGYDIGAYEYASGAPTQFTIHVTATTGGTISPPVGDVEVIAGSDQSFTVTPSTGYHIADIKKDVNTSVRKPSYTFPSVMQNHTIEAIFARLGDVNSDGLINVRDLILVARAFGKQFGDTGYDPRCDQDDNNRIDIKDLLVVARHFGQ